MVPIGLVSVMLGVIGFILMVSGMNRAMSAPGSVEHKDLSDLSSVRLDRQRIKDDLDLSRHDEPTAKI
jgi:hypothetical protein